MFPVNSCQSVLIKKIIFSVFISLPLILQTGCFKKEFKKRSISGGAQQLGNLTDPAAAPCSLSDPDCEVNGEDDDDLNPPGLSGFRLKMAGSQIDPGTMMVMSSGQVTLEMNNESAATSLQISSLTGAQGIEVIEGGAVVIPPSGSRSFDVRVQNPLVSVSSGILTINIEGGASLIWPVQYVASASASPSPGPSASPSPGPSGSPSPGPSGSPSPGPSGSPSPGPSIPPTLPTFPPFSADELRLNADLMASHALCLDPPTGTELGDVCIIYKNPVVAKGAIYTSGSPLSTVSNLASLLRYSAKLSVGLVDGTYLPAGPLKNTTFHVKPPEKNLEFTLDNLGQVVREETTPIAPVSFVPGGMRSTVYSRGCGDGTCAEDPDHKIGQLTSYFYISELERISREITRSSISPNGVFYPSNYNPALPSTHSYPVGDLVRVNSFSNELDYTGVAAWSPDENTLHLGLGAYETNSKLQEYALSAEVIAHEMGHTNLDYAVDYTGATLADINALELSVGLPGQNLTTLDTNFCATGDGCFYAIHEGQADYHAAILFPESPKLGESFVNDLNGVCSQPQGIAHPTLSTALNKICRNVAVNSVGLDLASDLYYFGKGLLMSFNSPGEIELTLQGNTYYVPHDSPGAIHDLGAVYAAAWWRVRTKISQTSQISNTTPQVRKEVDRLFFAHLQYLSPSSTFLSALQAIRIADNQLYGGRYYQLFVDQFRRRGIVLPLSNQTS